MKRTSIVSLIVAITIIALGLITCVVAVEIADRHGQRLFSESGDDGKIETVDLSENEISKIELDVDLATVNIIGGADRSYIEFIGFNELFYTLNTANRVLSFNEIDDIKSFASFWENPYSFKGMRYFLNLDMSEKTLTDRVINIYLEDEREIRAFDLTANTMVLNIEGISSHSDYRINCEALTLNCRNVVDASAINIGDLEAKPLGAVSVNIENSSMYKLTANVKSLTVSASGLAIDGNVDLRGGDISADMTLDHDSSLDLKITDGDIYVNNEYYLAKYTVNAADAPIIKISADSGEIKVTHDIKEIPTEENNTDVKE